LRDRYDTRNWDENRRSGSSDWDRDRDYGYGYGQQGYNRDMSGDYGQDDPGGQGSYSGYGQGQGWNQGQRYGGQGGPGQGQNRNQGQNWNQGRGGYGSQYGQGQSWNQGRGQRGYGGYGNQGGYQGQGGYGQGGYQGQGTAYYDIYAIWWTPGEHTGRGPKNYQRSDDRVREDVSEQLTQSGQIDAHDIEVDVSNGIVTLKGTVPDRSMKRMAEDAADSCPGVKDVHNELRVQDHDHDQQGQSMGQQSSQQGQQGQSTRSSSQSGQTSKSGQASQTASSSNR
jgi:hypothetical protein